jgi:integrase
MAGVRSKPKKGGNFQGYFVNWTGKRQFFTGTRSRTETLRIARRLEDEQRQIRLGYRPVPKSAEKHRKKPFAEAAAEYVAWGKMQGGRRGGPWGKVHADKKERHLELWRQTLELETLANLDGILPRVEAVLRALNEQGRAGRTIRNIADAISTFCNWCVVRGYLLENPLADLGKIDTTPVWERRALTLEEIRELLRVAPEYRRILYELAMLSGLRAGELQSLTRDHLDTERCGLKLDAAWTKNRRKGFQPLPERLVKRLASYADSGVVLGLYQQFYANFPQAERALVYVPSHPARELDDDLQAAGIPKMTKDGKLDFAALRNSYVTLAAEAGANVKELQTLARHSTPSLTLNVYAKNRNERLSELAEKIGESVLFEPKCAMSVPHDPIEGHVIPPKLLEGKELKAIQSNGGNADLPQNSLKAHAPCNFLIINDELI